jgi:hypothetical protein
MPRHAALGTNVLEGLEPTIRRVSHEGQHWAVRYIYGSYLLMQAANSPIAFLTALPPAFSQSFAALSWSIRPVIAKIPMIKM